MAASTLTYKYRFQLDDGKLKIFEVILDKKTLDLIEPLPKLKPDWAKMETFQCPNCPLNKEDYEYCPLALNLAGIIDFFKDTPSYEKAIIFVEDEKRGSYKYAAVQVGISSLMGMVMAVSPCPIIGKLKPLVRFHLPFASLIETEIRVLSMYVLAQYFKFLDTGKFDWNLENLKRLYSEIQIVNKNIVDKLADVEIQDANRNAVVGLSNFAAYIKMSIEEEGLANIKRILSEFFN